jgi:hypothetical protein
MLHQLRALFRAESPLPAHLHYHLDDEGRKVLCDESRCQPLMRDPRTLSPYLLPR